MRTHDPLADALADWHVQTVPVGGDPAMEAERERDMLTELAVDNAKLRRQNEHLKADNFKLRQRLAEARSMAAIKRVVAQKHKVTIAEMEGPGRYQSYVRARAEAMWLIRNRLGKSLPEIGRVFGDRDHTTVLHNVRAHQARLDAGEVE